MLECIRTLAGTYPSLGLFPVNQLSSDDFDGPIANRSNLAVKAILGIGAYALLCDLLGDSTSATKYMSIARYVGVKDVTRLAFTIQVSGERKKKEA